MSIENRGIGEVNTREEEGYPFQDQDVNYVAGFASFSGSGSLRHKTT
jgi:hypothetical protein